MFRVAAGYYLRKKVLTLYLVFMQLKLVISESKMIDHHWKTDKSYIKTHTNTNYLSFLP